MKYTDGRYLVGHCAVDSGQLLIVDPCYLDEWQAGEYDALRHDRQEQAQNDYERACRVTLDHLVGLTLDGMAVVSSTGYGDGSYPVYATFYRGRVARLEILFDGDGEEEST